MNAKICYNISSLNFHWMNFTNFYMNNFCLEITYGTIFVLYFLLLYQIDENDQVYALSVHVFDYNVNNIAELHAVYCIFSDSLAVLATKQL